MGTPRAESAGDPHVDKEDKATEAQVEAEDRLHKHHDWISKEKDRLTRHQELGEEVIKRLADLTGNSREPCEHGNHIHNFEQCDTTAKDFEITYNFKPLDNGSDDFIVTALLTFITVTTFLAGFAVADFGAFSHADWDEPVTEWLSASWGLAAPWCRCYKFAYLLLMAFVSGNAMYLVRRSTAAADCH